MSFESKISKVQIVPKSIADKPRPFESPEKRKPSEQSESASKGPEPNSPRYRSPIHSRIPHTAEGCPTCEKRLQEPVQVKFHESPPKVRPSHHHVVCEDCSEGSFSHVLKVICLNETKEAELATGTQKVKIIESTPAIPTSSSFPIIGNGQTVQVLYQEVYPPPKPELTSMLPESYRENGVLKYTLKEEERKRVAIRRAEYANRIKGVSKTIITTVSPHCERVSRKEGKLSVDLLAESADEDERLVRSERKSAKSLLKVRNDEKGLKHDENINNAKTNFIQENSKVTPAKDGLWKTSYFGTIRDKAAGGERASVKHKILAKLAGKDFSKLLRDEQDDLDEQKDPNLESENDEIEEDKNLSNFKQEKQSNLSEFLKKNDLNSSSLNQEKHLNLEEISQKDDLNRKSEQNIRNFLENSEASQEKHIKVAENALSDRNLTSENNEYKLVDEDFPHNEDLSESQKSISENPGSKPTNFEKTGKNSFSPSATFGKTLKSGENTGRDPEVIHEDISIPEFSHDYSKTSKFFSPIILNACQANNKSPEVQDFISPSFPEPHQEAIPSLADDVNRASIKNSSLDSSNEKLLEPSPILNPEPIGDPSSSFSLNLRPGFELNQSPPDSSRASLLAAERSPKAFDSSEETETHVKSSDIEKPAGQSRPSLHSNQSIHSLHSTLANPLQETSDTPVKPVNDGTFSQDKSQLERINHLFLILADPQVIKGLKLLGGFADYLEKNGKDVLDWKL